MDLAAELPQPVVRVRRRHQLESGTNGSCDAVAARLLCLLEKLGRHLDRDLTRRFHDNYFTILDAGLEYGKVGPIRTKKAASIKEAAAFTTFFAYLQRRYPPPRIDMPNPKLGPHQLEYG